MSHGLPYDWRPLGVAPWYQQDRDAIDRELPIGTLLPWAHKVYVLAETRHIPEDLWTDDERAYVSSCRDALARHQSPEPDSEPLTIVPPPDWVLRQYDVGPPRIYRFAPYPQPADPVAAMNAMRKRGLRHRGWLLGGRRGCPDVYPDEHFPQCAKCGEPAPCRDQVAVKQATESLRQMEQFEDPTKCPACQERVSPRQGVETFAWNLHVPAGPPVTFHTRQKCLPGLVKYRKELKAADYFTLKAMAPEGKDT